MEHDSSRNVNLTTEKDARVTKRVGRKVGRVALRVGRKLLEIKRISQSQNPVLKEVQKVRQSSRNFVFV